MASTLRFSNTLAGAVIRPLHLAGLLLVVAGVQPVPAQSRIVQDTVRSAALAHNRLGDSASRPVLVYLPPSYGRSPARRYPVLYLLHGFTSHPGEWLDSTYDGLDLRLAMDSVTAGSPRDEFIVVMPDANNPLGGSVYLNSPVSGNWDDFVIHDVIGHVDARYRTLPDRAHRALAGHSMGGFGALVLGLAHPAQFSLLYAMSPCCTSLVGEFGSTSETWRAASHATTATPTTAPHGTTLVIAMAAALSPSTTRARGYGALPFEPDAGDQLQRQPVVASRWLARMPQALAIRLVQQHAAIPTLYLDWGTHDQVLSVDPGVAALRRTLDSLGVRYTARPFDGGHVDQVRQRIREDLLPTVAAWARAGDTSRPPAH